MTEADERLYNAMADEPATAFGALAWSTEPAPEPQPGNVVAEPLHHHWRVAGDLAALIVAGALVGAVGLVMGFGAHHKATAAMAAPVLPAPSAEAPVPAPATTVTVTAPPPPPSTVVVPAPVPATVPEPQGSSIDERFLEALAARHIASDDPTVAVGDAHRVCAYLAQGHSRAEVVAQFQVQSRGMAGAFTDAAEEVYCPDA